MIKFNIFLRYKRIIISVFSIIAICVIAIIILTSRLDEASPSNQQVTLNTMSGSFSTPSSDKSVPPKDIDMLPLQDAFDSATFKVDDQKSYNTEKLDQFIYNSEHSKSDSINVTNYYSDGNHNRVIKDWYYLTCENNNITLYVYYLNKNNKYTYDDPMAIKKIIRKVMPDAINYRLSTDNSGTNTAKFFYANNPVLAPKTASECVNLHLSSSRSGILLYYLSSQAQRSRILSLVTQMNWYLGVSSPHMSDYKILTEKEVDGKYIVDVQETWEAGGQEPSIQNAKFTVINEDGRICIDSSSAR